MSKLWIHGWYRFGDDHFLLIGADHSRNLLRVMWLDGRHDDVEADELEAAAWISKPIDRPQITRAKKAGA